MKTHEAVASWEHFRGNCAIRLIIIIIIIIIIIREIALHVP
jgi:hypothetical protein